MAYDWERDEWGAAVAELSEMERAQTCRHWWAKGYCQLCGESADDE